LIQDIKFLNLDKVLQNKILPNWVLKAAFEVRQNQFLPAGDYFEKLDDVEVYEIQSSLNYINTIDFEQFHVFSENSRQDLENLSLLCFILALGEGEVEMTTAGLSSMLEHLFLLVKLESAHRNGKVDVIRENYSIFPTNKIVIQNRKGNK
tara:strand:+ start:193 stop:642 length:450 start_codon:yes stop_codon:yes gene_type:complete